MLRRPGGKCWVVDGAKKPLRDALAMPSLWTKQSNPHENSGGREKTQLNQARGCRPAFFSRHEPLAFFMLSLFSVTTQVPGVAVVRALGTRAGKRQARVGRRRCYSFLPRIPTSFVLGPARRGCLARHLPPWARQSRDSFLFILKSSTKRKEPKQHEREDGGRRPKV